MEKTNTLSMAQPATKGHLVTNLQRQNCGVRFAAHIQLPRINYKNEQKSTWICQK